MDFTLFIFLMALTGLSIICLVMCIVCMGKVSALSSSVQDTEKYAKAVKSYYEKLKALPVSDISVSQGAFCKSSVVRFNAFGDITGAVSFSVALLTSANDGFILTSIYGRESCNTYIREVKRGECDVNLLAEERKALESAIGQEVN